MSHETALKRIREIAQRLRVTLQACRANISSTETSLRHEVANRDRLEQELRELEATIMVLEELANVDRGQPANSDPTGPDGPAGPDIVAT